MRALRLKDANCLELGEVEEPRVAKGEVLVKVAAASLNHRDLWIKSGQYAGMRYPVTPGSDGSGIVTDAAEGVSKEWIGRDVLINPSCDWGARERAQSSKFTILGLPRDGTFAEYVAVPVANVIEKPSRLSWYEAAALPLSGLTAWRALFARAKLRAGERVLITGIGGGVALFALQLAKAAGADVWVTSSADEKVAKALSLGASGGFNYTLKAWLKDAAAGVPTLFDVIVDGAGGPGFDQLLDLASPGGRIVFYGATRGAVPQLSLRKAFYKQLDLLGTTMGSPNDFSEMTEFVGRHRLKPVISETFPLERAFDAFSLMEQGGQFGKVVLRIGA